MMLRMVMAMVGICWLAMAVNALAQEVPHIGIDCNYALDMARQGKQWRDASGAVDPFVLFARAGCRDARIRLWVGDEGSNRLTYATQTARRAQEAGLKPYLVIFLSDTWADLVKQPAPEIWRNLPTEKKLPAIEAYTENVCRHFADNGINIDTFQIGNEIDFGICGEFEEAWPHRVSIEFMQQKVWPLMVPILKSAQAGVLKANPKARFIVHLAQWNNVRYCVAFWQAMAAAGVQMDYPGLSYYPSSSEKAPERGFEFLRAQAGIIFDALHKPVILCESGYPAMAQFGGQFSAWNHSADGYPLSDAGQAKWIADLVAMVGSDRHFAGLYYWSPEWYGGGLWDAFALFDGQGVARSGIQSFRQIDAATQPASTRPAMRDPMPASTKP